jgi:hypothetical protein
LLLRDPVAASGVIDRSPWRRRPPCRPRARGAPCPPHARRSSHTAVLDKARGSVRFKAISLHAHPMRVETAVLLYSTKPVAATVTSSHTRSQVSGSYAARPVFESRTLSPRRVMKFRAGRKCRGRGRSGVPTSAANRGTTRAGGSRRRNRARIFRPQKPIPSRAPKALGDAERPKCPWFDVN